MEKLVNKILTLLDFYDQWGYADGAFKHKPTGVSIYTHRFRTRIRYQAHFFYVKGKLHRRLKTKLREWEKWNEKRIEDTSVKEIESIINDPSKYTPKEIIRLRNSDSW